MRILGFTLHENAKFLLKGKNEEGKIRYMFSGSWAEAAEGGNPPAPPHHSDAPEEVVTSGLFLL